MLDIFTTFTRRLRRYADDIRGVASIEMAFIFPAMVLVYFGLVDATNVLSANRRVTPTASTLANLVTQAPGTSPPPTSTTSSMPPRPSSSRSF